VQKLRTRTFSSSATFVTVLKLSGEGELVQREWVGPTGVGCWSDGSGLVMLLSCGGGLVQREQAGPVGMGCSSFGSFIPLQNPKME
jgi:hypothetical protein